MLCIGNLYLWDSVGLLRSIYKLIFENFSKLEDIREGGELTHDILNNGFKRLRRMSLFSIHMKGRMMRGWKEER